MPHTETVPKERIRSALLEVFDLRPAAILRDLDLTHTRYRPFASYGHFGRDPESCPWERVDRAEALLEAV